MTLSADNLLDRILLKRSLRNWRILAILAVTAFFVVLAISAENSIRVPANYIARVNVDGVIFEDSDRDKIIKSLKEDKHVKAVVVYINSPGGTIVGSENLYYALQDVAKTKPVVAVMGSLAASGGYMAAIAADKIYARAGTLTGSVGVLMQSFDVTELGKKLGVGFITFKSGKLKASPSPFEKLDADVEKAIKESIADSFDLFLGMVVERRELADAQINGIKDGRILTGRQALKLKLVDEIGGQDEAIKWLQDEKAISKKLEVIDVELESKKKFVEKLLSKVTGGNTPLAFATKGGILAMWGM